MEVDATLLSRLQFAFTLGFYILFPTLTIGLSGFLVLLHGAWLWTGVDAYLRLYRFWLAAAPATTQTFMLLGTAVLLPLVLGYT